MHYIQQHFYLACFHVRMAMPLQTVQEADEDRVYVYAAEEAWNCFQEHGRGGVVFVWCQCVCNTRNILKFARQFDLGYPVSCKNKLRLKLRH